MESYMNSEEYQGDIDEVKLLLQDKIEYLNLCKLKINTELEITKIDLELNSEHQCESSHPECTFPAPIPNQPSYI